MNNMILKLYVKAQSVAATFKNEEGQDLIEYALVAGLVITAAIAGMGYLSPKINTAFGNVGNSLTANT
jgi:pilus assembly protein Flp/PilA